MAYSNFTKLKKIVQTFNIKVERENIFLNKDITLLPPSDWLTISVERGYKMGFESEKERSERLISPILTELSYINQEKITIYSGHDLDADKDKGLKGETDYLIALGKKALDFIATPILSVVEAKRQDMEHGTAQCVAQMIGAAKYNAADNILLPYIYGATTDGEKWRFLQLTNNTLRIHEENYYTNNLPLLLGILQYFINDIKNNTSLS